MSNQRRPAAQRVNTRLFVTILVIAIGIAIAVFFGVRAVTSFQQIQYIHQQGLDSGTASVNAIRSWMTIRFVAVAYAVPEEYLYSQLDIPFDQRNRDQTLKQINDAYKLGDSPNGPRPAIIDRVRDAVTSYRANPVATGLRDVRPWMSVRYIANSTGIPEQTIFAAINLLAAGNENKPLDLLSREQHYPGGPRALAEAIQNALAQQKATP